MAAHPPSTVPRVDLDAAAPGAERAGESVVEAPGVTHVTWANASRSAPATLVATVVCDRDAPEPAGPAR